MKFSKFSLLAAAALIFSANTFAGAFQLWEQDAAGTGDYHAGGAAEADSAATIFYNPAGMSRIKHQQLSFGAAFIVLKTNFQGTATSDAGNGVTPSNGVSGDTFNVVPNFHYLAPITDRIAFGLSETTPFGLSTNYADINSIGMLATQTTLKTINLNPSLSYEINPHLSFGAGFDAMYGIAIYDNTIDLAPLTNDLTGWGYGYNAGMLYQFSKKTRVGLSYRSAITIQAQGPSEFDVPGDVNRSTVSANFPLPPTTMFSVYHDMNHHFAVMASAFYTQWSCFRQLVIKNIAQLVGTGTVTLNENYRNTWNIAVGGRYQFTRYFALECGVGHDETPTRLPYRDIRLPDSDHYVASVGFNIRPRHNMLWSIGWTHLFIDKTRVDNSGSDAGSTTNIPPAVGVGSISAGVNVFGVQLTWDI